MPALTPSHLTSLPRFVHDYEDGVSRLYLMINTDSGPRLELLASFKTTKPVAQAITDELNDACESFRPPNLERWTRALREAVRTELTSVVGVLARDLVAPPAFGRPAIERFGTTSPDLVAEDALARQEAGMLPIITNCLTAEAGLTYCLATYPGRLEFRMEVAADVPALDNMELISRTPIAFNSLASALAEPNWSQHAARAMPVWIREHGEDEDNVTTVAWLVDIYRDVPAVTSDDESTALLFQ